jgi:hypothetical protein
MKLAFQAARLESAGALPAKKEPWFVPGGLVSIGVLPAKLSNKNVHLSDCRNFFLEELHSPEQASGFSGSSWEDQPG